MPIELKDYGGGSAQPDPMIVPPGTRAPNPGKPADPAPSGAPKPGAIPGLGTVSEADALRGGEGAKIDQVSLTPYGGNPGASGGPGNSVGLGTMIEGKLAIEAIDALLPALLVLAFRAGGMVMKKSDMQLSAKEKDVLAPLVQKCLDSIMLNFNSPWTALAVTAISIYGAKVLEHGGAAFLDKKKDIPAKAEKTVKERAEEIKKEEAAKEQAATLPNVPDFTEEDVKRYAKEKKISKAAAKAWLEINWKKKGGNVW